jgi:hypothetical protein
MKQLTSNNHFKFGYDHDWFQPRKSPHQTWTVQYGPCERPVGNFQHECLKTALKIQDNARQKMTVLFSGGVDSEVALQSFVLAKVPVTAAILRFKNDLNIHDISYAIITCDKLGIKYKIFDLDIIHFWENQLLDYADPTYCISPQLLSTMWLADQIDEYPILGSGECLLVKDYDDSYQPGVSPYTHSEWSLWEKEKIAAWYRHFIVKNRPACPGFFQYTPEVILSYLLDPIVQKLTRSEIVGKLSTESSKLQIYQQHFSLIERPKFTGFEHIQAADSYFRKILTDRFPETNQIYKNNVTDLKKSMTYSQNTSV